MVTVESFTEWMDYLGRAWVEANPQNAGRLFTDDARYREDRFAAPMVGREAIIAYWEDVPRTQKDIEFGYRIIGVTPESGIAHWWASFTRIPTDVPVKLDGILIAYFDDSHHCHTFEEWWQIHEPESA